MKNVTNCSTGVPTLDSLIGEVRAGDNFVFNTSSLQWFKPLSKIFIQNCIKGELDLTLIRVDGSLDNVPDHLAENVRVLDLKTAAFGPESLRTALRNQIRANGSGGFYIFDNASALKRILKSEKELVGFFKYASALFKKNEAVVYWPFVSKQHSAEVLAALKDLAPVFVELKKQKSNLVLRIIKAVGRYSGKMFLPHRVTVDHKGVTLTPVETVHRSFREYARELEVKNRELLHIKKNLERTREELLLRAKELNTINRVAKDVTRYIERDKILDNALKTTINAMELGGGAVFLLDDNAEQLLPVAASNIPAEALAKLAQKATWEQVFGEISSFLKPVTLFDIDNGDYLQWFGGLWKTVFVIPLRAKSQLVGAMLLASKQRRRFSARELAMLRSIGNQIALAILHIGLYRQVENSEARYHNLFESAQDGILIIDAETGLIQEANAQANALTGYSDKQLKSMPFWDLTVAENRAKILAGFSSGNLEKQLVGEIPLLRKGGSVLMTEMYSNIVEIGGRRMIQCLMRNITSRVKSERMIVEAVEKAEAFNLELAQKNLELEEISRSKSEFLNFVSHELRTPLTSLQWSAGHLQKVLSDVDIEDTQHLLHIISEDSHKLFSLVNQLLEFSRIEARKLRLDKRAQAILPLVHSIVDRKKDRIHEKQIKFSVHAPRNLAKVIFDSQQIEVVLNNLVDNSLKYSNSKGSIEIHLKQKMDREPLLEIRVKDTGIGIPEGDLERVFEKFYRGGHKEILKTPGTGLGLPISKAIVEAHNGEIWAETHEERGCVVAFTLPMAQEKTLVNESSPISELSDLNAELIGST